jgi:4-amino-4-deoxy-L-arabinose transferase-like glycosyltransferase
MTLRVWTLGLCVVGATVIAATVGDYGINWDEGGQARYGEAVVEYFRSGEKAWEVSGDFQYIRYYGGLFEATAALAYEGASQAKYLIRHVLTALCGLLCVVAVIRYGQRALDDAWVAVFASLALATLPRFYGHAFMNSKDIPFACAFAWGVFATWRFASQPRGWRTAVLCGLALGATLAMRPGGLPLVAAVFGVAVAWAVLAGRSPGLLAGRGLAVWAIAWTLMVAFWPWSHEDPLLRPFRAVSAAAAFPRTITVLFEGVVARSDDLPRYYHLKYLWITTPPFALLLLAVGAVSGIRNLWRERWQPASLAILLLGFWLLAPLLLSLVLRPSVYDGIRHVLFVLPAAALLVGLGAATIVRAVPPQRRLVVAGALLFACALPVPSLVRLHPYQMTYFNAFVGGVRGAQERYDTEYWVTSYKEAIEWVNGQASLEPGRELHILVGANAWSKEAAFWYLGRGVRATPFYRWQPGGEIPPGFDYYVATTRYRLDESFGDSPVVHAVARDGATFTVIRGRVGDAAQPPRGAAALP